jgi:hypothetical protein
MRIACLSIHVRYLRAGRLRFQGRRCCSSGGGVKLLLQDANFFSVVMLLLLQLLLQDFRVPLLLLSIERARF